MFDNDFETAINFYFFLKESEYVFSQFVTTVGKTDPDTGELFLEDNPAFRKASTQRVHFQTDVLQCSFLSLESIFLF